MASGFWPIIKYRVSECARLNMTTCIPVSSQRICKMETRILAALAVLCTVKPDETDLCRSCARLIRCLPIIIIAVHYENDTAQFSSFTYCS